MKKIALLIPMFLAVQALAEGTPVLVQSPLENVYAPLGFDDNDNTEVVIHGHFTNSCMKVGPVSASVNASTREVRISAQSYRYDDPLCEREEMWTPFTQSVSLGVLQKGKYTVRVEGRPDLGVTTLDVGAHLSPNPDEHLYAPVEYVELIEDNANQTQKLQIRGEFPRVGNGCLVLDEVRVEKASNHSIVVLPIARLVNGVSACEDISRQIDEVVSLPEYYKGRYLIHVRVLNGMSLNKVFELGQE